MAEVSLRPMVTQCQGSNLVLDKCLWGGRAMTDPWNGLLLLLLFNGRLNGQSEPPWLMLSMTIWVVIILKHLPPAWFTVSALSPQVPPLQRWPGSSPRTPGPRSGLSIKPFTPGTAASSGLPSLLASSWPLSGGIHGALVVTSLNYLLCSKNQTQQPIPLLPLPSLPHSFFSPLLF